MIRLFLISLCFMFSIQANAQVGDSIVEFFDNIFGLSGLIEGENKARLERELTYYAQNMDELIIVKKEISVSMLEHCEDDNIPVIDKLEDFNKLIRNSVTNLENIRKNILFETDYNIEVETIHVPTPIEKDEELADFGPDCYIQIDTTYKVDDLAPQSYTNMAAQMEMPQSNSEKRDTIIVKNVYCPKVVESKEFKSSWKTVSFEEMVEVFKYSLNAKSRNIDHLLNNCDKKLIRKERERSIKVLKQMRDKALALKRGLSND